MPRTPRQAVVGRPGEKDATPQEDTAHSVDLVRANPLGIPLAVLPVVPLVLLHALLCGWPSVGEAFSEFRGSFPRLLLAVLVGVVVHEGVHALTWGICGGHGLQSVRVGFQRQTMTPFARCQVPITAWSYRLGVAMPGLLTGVVPAVAGSIAGMPGPADFGWLMTFCAGGDLLVLVLLRRVPADALVEDHPTRAGCTVVDCPQPG